MKLGEGAGVERDRGSRQFLAGVAIQIAARRSATRSVSHEQSAPAQPPLDVSGVAARRGEGGQALRPGEHGQQPDLTELADPGGVATNQRSSIRVTRPYRV
nr:hypothetical protein [Salinispora arenicola]